MPKFDDYTQKTTPEDTDIVLILDKTANVNKKTPFSGIWNWIVNKMTNAAIQNLQTTNKTVIGSINELNSKKINKSGWSSNKFLGTNESGNIIEKDAPEGESIPNGGTTGQVLTKKATAIKTLVGRIQQPL